MTKRRSGVLLHITSLKSKEGIGTLGKSAYEFVDYLKKAKQTLWQVLPLGPTGYGDSPYASFSTFAGNPLLIDLELLVEKNWAKEDVLNLPDYIKTNGNIDYGSVVWWKIPVLFQCANYFLKNASKEDLNHFELFKKENQFWLDDYASFTSIKNFFDKKAQEMNVCGQASMWNNFWPKDLASHKEKAIQKTIRHLRKMETAR
jgi:4-alpha-glucanotransferase